MRAQYATVAVLTLMMLTQVAGVVIFSGRAQATGPITYSASITTGYDDEALDRPAAVAVAPDGSYYIASMGSNKIHKYNSSGVAISEIGGTPGSGNGQIDQPYSLAVDKDSNLYVFESGNLRIQKFDASGSYLAKWGSGGSGDGQFGYSVDIAISPNGRVYATDKSNSRVQAFDSSGNFLLKWGSYGWGPGLLSSPEGIAVDSSGNVWVCDPDNGYISKFTATGTYINHPAGNVTTCNAIAINTSGEVLMTVDGPNMVRKYTQQGVVYTGLGGSGTGNTQFDFYNETYGLVRSSIAVSLQGKVYVADLGNERVQVYDDASSYVAATTTAGATSITQTSAVIHGTSSLQGVTGRGFQIGTTTSYALDPVSDTSAVKLPYVWSYGEVGAGAAQIDSRDGLAIATDGTIYVSGGNAFTTSEYQVKKYDGEGDHAYQGGIGLQGSGAGYLTAPGRVAFDSAGNAYAPDGSASHSIHKFSSVGTFIDSWSTTGGFIAIDSNDYVYASDPTTNTIQKFNNSGTLITSWNTMTSSSNQFMNPSDISVAGDDTLYVLDATNGRVGHFDGSGAYLGAWGSLGNNPEQLDEPRSLVVEGSNAYVVDYTQHVIKKFTLDGTYITSLQPLRANGTVAYPASIDFSANGDLVMLDATSNVYAIYEYRFNEQSIDYSLTGLTCGTTYHYRATSTNSQGTAYGDDQTFSTAACTPPPSIQITTTSLPNAVAGVQYSQVIETNVPDAQFWVDHNTLPTGLSLAEDGTLSGVSSFEGTYTFTINAIDMVTEGNPTTNKQFTITVLSSPFITSLNLADGVKGQEYSDTIQTSNVNGTPNFSIISGSLPTGLQLDTNTGEVYGIPDESTAYTTSTFTVQLTDDTGIDTDSVSIYIDGYDPLSYCGPSGQEGTVNQYFSASTCTTGGFGYKSFALSAGYELPPGLNIDGVSGDITGTPGQAGTYQTRVDITDLTGTATANITFTIADAPARTNTPIVTITSPSSNTSFDYLHDDVTIMGTGPANQTITTYMDGYQLGTTTTNGSGNWSYLANNVFPGNHSFDAKWIPSGDVAFVPYMDMGVVSSNISIIDAVTKKLIKTLYLPSYAGALGAAINHAGTKVYITGTDMTSISPLVWEYDIASDTLTNQLSVPYPSYYYAGLVISEDDHYLYASVLSPGGGGSGNESPPVEYHKIDITTMSFAGALPDLTPINLQAEAMLISMVSPNLHGNSLYSIASVTDGNDPYTISAIDLINESISSITASSDPAWRSLSPQMTVAGDNVYVAVNNKLAIIDANTHTKTKEITIPGLQQNFDANDDLVVSIAVDEVHQKAYLVTYLRKLYVVDIASEAITSFEVSPEEVFNDQYPLMSTQLSSDATHLYIPDLGYGKLRSFNVGTQAFEAVESDTMPSATTSYLTSDFVGRIASPTATVSFSVGTAPLTPTPDPEPTPVPDPTPPTTTPEPEQPTITDVTPAPSSTPAAAPTTSSPITAPQTVVATQNNLFALAKRIPEPIAIGFPWFLLALALVLVGIQYYQVHTEATATKRLQQSVAHQQRLVEEQNNFVALSTHYLHTPLTVMEGEISLMTKAGTLTQEQATKLQATLTSLNAEAEATLAQEEQNNIDS